MLFPVETFEGEGEPPNSAATVGVLDRMAAAIFERKQTSSRRFAKGRSVPFPYQSRP